MALRLSEENMTKFVEAYLLCIFNLSGIN